MNEATQTANQIWTYVIPIIGLVIGAITAFGVFYGPRLTAKWQRRQQKQDNLLKAHFEEMKREVQEITRIISRVTQNYGKIESHSQASYSEITSFVLPHPSDRFMAHFTEETTKLLEYRRRIEAHNRDYEEFRSKIIAALESEGTIVLDYKILHSSPSIPESVVDPLISYWREFTTNGRTWPDFRWIQEVQTGDGRIDLCPKGWNATIAARVDTESQKLKYIDAFHKVAGNEEFKREATTVSSSARQLVDEITTFRAQLLDKVDNVYKLWPGVKNYEFRKITKICPRCKEIFG